MPLKEVAIALLVPPTSLVFLALLGLLIGWRYRRIGRLAVWLGILALLVLAIPAVGGTLLAALEENLPLTPPPEKPPQAIVILGGDTERGGAQMPIEHIGPLSLERVLTGAQLARRTSLPILITGGRLHASEPPVAALMADSMEHDFQVPVKWVERKSRDTWQNAYLSAPILREHGIQSIYLVTQAWHERRAIVAFRGTGLTVTAAPTHLDRAPVLFATDFLPSVGGWRASYFALHEWIGWAWYSLRALIGPA